MGVGYSVFLERWRETQWDRSNLDRRLIALQPMPVTNFRGIVQMSEAQRVCLDCSCSVHVRDLREGPYRPMVILQKHNLVLKIEMKN